MILISLDDAIDALNECADIRGYDYKTIHDALMSVPARKGSWIPTSKFSYGAKIYKCSYCGEEIDDIPTDKEGKPLYKGCPYCLAVME